MTDDPDVPSPTSEEEPAEPEVVPDGIEELIAWLKSRVPAYNQAKFAERCIRRLENEVRNPALVYAWEHRREGATMKDLEAATGVNRARITWALGKHPAADV